MYFFHVSLINKYIYTYMYIYLLFFFFRDFFRVLLKLQVNFISPYLPADRLTSLNLHCIVSTKTLSRRVVEVWGRVICKALSSLQENAHSFNIYIRIFNITTRCTLQQPTYMLYFFHS